jgi:hypothetical protein
VIRTDEWTHVAATYDGSRVRLYENGVEVYSAAVTGSGRRNSYPVGIGRHPTSATRHFNGRINEVRLLSRALISDEVRGDYNVQGHYPTRSGTAAWYHEDEGTGTTVADASGNGNTGTIYGAGWRPRVLGGPEYWAGGTAAGTWTTLSTPTRPSTTTGPSTPGRARWRR